MNQLDDEILLDELGKKPFDGKRPVFLLVLCILTWCGCFFILFLNLYLFAVMSVADNIFEASNSADPNGEFQNAYNWLIIDRYLSLGGMIFCLAGSLFMFFMKKIGFIIYVLGQIIPFTSYFFTFGTNMSEFGAIEFEVLSIVLYSAIPVGFIIMYGLNLQYMNR